MSVNSSNDWAIHFPDYGAAKVPTSPLGPVDLGANQAGCSTVFDRAANLLAAHPKSQLCHISGVRFEASVPAGSPITEEVLRHAFWLAGQYNQNPPMGRPLRAARIQRLLLGLNELLQAEMVIDPGVEPDHIERELRAVVSCLRRGVENVSDSDDSGVSGDDRSMIDREEDDDGEK